MQENDHNEGVPAPHTAPDSAHLESLVNAIGGVVWEFDWSTGAFTFVSDAAEALLGYRKSEWLVPGFWTDHLHPEDAVWAPQYCMACTRDRRDHEFEYRMIAQDGRAVWIREIVTVDAEKGMDGRLRGLMVDISERKAAEERFARSEGRFREIVENVGLLAVHIDAAGTVVFANAPVEALMGGSVTGRLFTDLLEGPARDLAKAAFDDLLAASGAGTTVETPLHAPDGLVHVVRWDSARMLGPRGEFAGVVSIGQDVTEHRAHEQAMARKAEEFDAIFHLSRDLYFRVDDSGHVVGYCASPDSPLYAPPEAFMNRLYAEVLPPNIARVLSEGAKRCHEAGDVVLTEYELPVGEEHREWEARFLPLSGGDTAVIVRDVTTRNARDARLQESEERYRTLVELAPYAIYVVSLDDIVLYCNDAAARLLGAGDVQELTGRCISHLFPSEYVAEAHEDEQRVARAVACLEPGAPVPVSPSMPATTLTLDGRLIDIERAVAGIHYLGQPALLVLARDVTEELEVQRAITESRDFLATLLEMLDAGVVVVDGARKVITRANRPAEMMFGYEHDEMLGMSTREIHLTQEAFEQFSARVVDTLGPGEMHASETQLKRSDGAVFDAEVSVRSLSGPGGLRLSTIRDVSDRKAADRMLRESEQRLRAIIEGAPFGMHFYRLDGDALIFLGSNPAAHAILGADMRAMEGQPIEDAFPGLVGTDVPDIYRRIAREGGTWQTEEISYDHGGISGAYEVTAFQIQPGRVAVIFWDVTERRSSEERERRHLHRLSAMTAELAQAEDAERRRLAEDLHDRVSQPLAVAMMHLRTAGTGAADGSEQSELERGRELLETAIGETRTITTELYPPVLHELGLGPALRWLCDEVERQHDLRCIASVEDPPRERLTADADAVLFRSTRELLMNVVKHARASTATVTLVTTPRYVEVVVEDDGIGFDVERVTVGGSSGFGLFSIKERLPHMGGEVEVHSTPGSGTRAALRMPWAAE